MSGTTTQVGQIDTPIVPAEYYGDFAADFDAESIEKAAIDALNDLIPAPFETVVVAYNGMVFADIYEAEEARGINWQELIDEIDIDAITQAHSSEREPAAKCTTEVSTDGLVWEVIAIDAPDEDGPLTLDEARFAADEAGTRPGLFVRLTLRDREDRILAQSPAYEVPERDFVAEYHEVDPTITIIHDGEDTDIVIIGGQALPAIIEHEDTGEEWAPEVMDAALGAAGWARTSEWNTTARTATVRRA